MNEDGILNLTNNKIIKSRSLRESAVRGSLWTMGGFGVAQILRLASNVVLAALLYQEAFALMAIVAALLQAFAMVSDFGVGPNIIQSKRGDNRAFLDTAWTVQIVRGGVLALLACALAYPVASFYAANDVKAWELRWMIPLVALGVFIQSFQSTKLTSAARHMNFGRLTIISLGSQVAGLISMVVCAWYMRSVYAMVVGGLVTASLQCILSHIALPGENNRFRWERQALGELFHFGKWVLVSTMLTFLASQMDKLLFARMLPLSEVGVYGIAVGLAMVTPMLMGRLQTTIAFPLYTRMRARNEALSDIVPRTKGPILAVGSYLVALIIACAGTFVGIAYDARYEAAALYTPIIAIGAWFGVVEGVYGAAFLSEGLPRWGAVGSLTKLIVFSILALPAVEYFGMLGGIVAIAVGDFMRLPVALIYARRLGLVDIKPELAYTIYLCCVGAGVLWLSARLVADFQLSPPVVLVVQFLLVTIMYIIPLTSAGLAILKRGD